MGRYVYEPNDYSDEIANGEIATVPTAIGDVVINFELLDDQLSTTIAFILRRGDQVGRAVTADLSFKGKVNLLCSLFRLDRPKSVNEEMLGELCAACLGIEEERNRVVHSKWGYELEGMSMLRTKFTARGKAGLRRQVESMNHGRVRSISHHCGFLADELDQLMFFEYGSDYGAP